MLAGWLGEFDHLAVAFLNKIDVTFRFATFKLVPEIRQQRESFPDVGGIPSHSVWAADDLQAKSGAGLCHIVLLPVRLPNLITIIPE